MVQRLLLVQKQMGWILVNMEKGLACFFHVGGQLHKKILESFSYISLSIHVGHAHFVVQAFEN